MNYEESHVSDRDLLLHLEGELSPRDAKKILAHVGGCWRCRARRQELETAIADFVGAYQRKPDQELPPADGPRALLKAQLAQLTSSHASNHPASGGKTFWSFRTTLWATAFAGLLALTLVPMPLAVTRSRPANRGQIVTVPDSRLTPGAALLVNRSAVCSQSNSNNKAVPRALQRAVFEEYGIAGADPRAYEVDYLVTPALGGADDIHNLWPHSYSATVWNAQVKDALESRMRKMVCDGSLDLSDAQREIAENWIAAYRKYFHTDKPPAER